MKHSATASFWKCYEALAAPAQSLADKNFELLKLDPSHSSLRLKNLRDDLWPVRIGLHYRALALKLDDGFAWFWIGSHADYDHLIK